jgi:hypothetical protein
MAAALAWPAGSAKLLDAPGRLGHDPPEQRGANSVVEGVEGIGDAVTGGMIARSVEPQAGEPHGHGTSCLNCGTRLIGEHCHRCGQQAHVHRSLGAFWHDIAHSVLHFEGKIWRTLPLLAFWPGELTRRYIAGERARFVSPMALFLFSVFLMFAVFSFVGGPASIGGPTRANFENGMEEAVKEGEENIREAEVLRRMRVAEGKDPAPIDWQLEELRDEVSLLRQMQSKGVTEATFSRATDDVGDAPGWFQKAYAKAKANPSLLIYKLQNNAYKFSWALIPLSVPFLWLLFPFSRRFHIYDHTVFVTYSLCFMTLLVIVLTLLGLAGAPPAPLFLAATLLPPAHMYKQLKGAYRLGRVGAAWRAILLIQFATIAATFFGLLLLALGALG